jgi:hypothetical protein
MGAGLMTVEEARFNIAKAIQLLELEVLRAQLDAAGKLTPEMNLFIDGVRDMVAATTYLGNTLAQAAADLSQSFGEAFTSFQDAWEALSAEAGSDQEQAIKRVQEKYDNVLRLFGAQNIGGGFTGSGFQQMIKFLQDQGQLIGAFKDANGWWRDINGNLLTMTEVMKIMEENVLNPLEAEEIAKILAGEDDEGSSLEDLISPLTDLLDQINFGNLGGVGSLAKFVEMMDEFKTVSADAVLGEEDAIEKFDDLAKDILELSSELFGSGGPTQFITEQIAEITESLKQGLENGNITVVDVLTIADEHRAAEAAAILAELKAIREAMDGPEPEVTH